VKDQLKLAQDREMCGGPPEINTSSALSLDKHKLKKFSTLKIFATKVTYFSL
jgi:hypothetical protein